MNKDARIRVFIPHTGGMMIVSRTRAVNHDKVFGDQAEFTGVGRRVPVPGGGFTLLNCRWAGVFHSRDIQKRVVLS